MTIELKNAIENLHIEVTKLSSEAWTLRARLMRADPSCLPGARGEMIAHITLAMRHMEDASHRLALAFREAARPQDP